MPGPKIIINRGVYAFFRDHKFKEDKLGQIILAHNLDRVHPDNIKPNIDEKLIEVELVPTGRRLRKS